MLAKIMLAKEWMSQEPSRQIYLLGSVILVG